MQDWLPVCLRGVKYWEAWYCMEDKNGIEGEITYTDQSTSENGKYKWQPGPAARMS